MMRDCEKKNGVDLHRNELENRLKGSNMNMKWIIGIVTLCSKKTFKDSRCCSMSVNVSSPCAISASCITDCWADKCFKCSFLYVWDKINLLSTWNCDNYMFYFIMRKCTLKTVITAYNNNITNDSFDLYFLNIKGQDCSPSEVKFTFSWLLILTFWLLTIYSSKRLNYASLFISILAAYYGEIMGQLYRDWWSAKSWVDWAPKKIWQKHWCVSNLMQTSAGV